MSGRTAGARSRSSRPLDAKWTRSEEHTSELQSQSNLVCRLLLEKKKQDLNLSVHFPVAAAPVQSIASPSTGRTRAGPSTVASHLYHPRTLGSVRGHRSPACSVQ